MKYAFETNPGKVREKNEDTCLIVENKYGDVLMMVFDGMGGHSKGDLASNKAKEYCPNIEFIINKKNITQEEEALFKLLLQYKNDDERDRKIANTLEISIEETKEKINNLYNKIQKDSTLKEYIAKKYGESTEIKNLFKPKTLTERQKEMLKLLNKHKDNNDNQHNECKVVRKRIERQFKWVLSHQVRIVVPETQFGHQDNKPWNHPR